MLLYARSGKKDCTEYVLMVENTRNVSELDRRCSVIMETGGFLETRSETMKKRVFRYSVGVAFLVFLLITPFGNTAFAYGGGSSGGGITDQKEVSAGEPGVIPGYEEEDFGVAGDTASLDPPPEGNTLENTWGKHLKKKPSHWTEKQWKDYVKKRQGIHRHQKNEAFEEEKSEDRKLKIAQGTGMAASAAGAVIGAVAAPAVAPTIVIISVAGDGLAATAGSLAEGKSVKESVKDGLKKSASSAILSTVGSGKTNAVIGFVGGQIYDNVDPSSGTPNNGMSNYHHESAPGFTTRGGHDIKY